MSFINNEFAYFILLANFSNMQIMLYDQTWLQVTVILSISWKLITKLRDNSWCKSCITKKNMAYTSTHPNMLNYILLCIISVNMWSYIFFEWHS